MMHQAMPSGLASEVPPKERRQPARRAVEKCLLRGALLLAACAASNGAGPGSFAGVRGATLPRSPRSPIVALAAEAATPASITISKKMSELDEAVKAVEKPEEELYWRVLAYCTACRTPWCKLPFRRHTCLKGDAKAEGARGMRCDMSWEAYTDLLTKSVPLISHKKAQILTRECWSNGDADPSGIGVVTDARLHRGRV
ncbi:unnamed protein product [Symbiodinium natans]|uniref:Uncharacterized protein n=1 Tax=Symbiodinium natans TaxID=878477 RepID=A0A812P5I5_9DINO|nr:unnamed protein product [Symbiodinium natans]